MGVKLTVIVQVAPAASEAPQLFVCEKGEDATIEVIERSASPLFESVRACGALVIPTSCDANVNAAGVTEATGAGTLPVPLKLTKPPMPAGEPLADKLADSEPAALGLKTTLRVQLMPGEIDAGQLFVWPKSEELMLICESV